MAWASLTAGVARGDDDPGAQLDVELRSLDLQLSALRFKAAMRLYLEQLAEYLQPRFRAVHFVREWDTLRRLAVHHYGEADYWTKIADANRLDADQLRVGMVLVIPEV